MFLNLSLFREYYSQFARLLKDMHNNTVCPRSSDPFYIVTYYIKYVTISWTDDSS